MWLTTFFWFSVTRTRAGRHLVTPSIVSWSVGKSKRGKKRVKEADRVTERILSKITLLSV